MTSIRACSTFVNRSKGPAYIGITAPNPLDKIVTLDLSELGGMRCARDSFVCSLVRGCSLEFLTLRVHTLPSIQDAGGNAWRAEDFSDG